MDFETTKDNELIAIIGAVGSGKSSFLSALLGEMIQTDGQRVIRGTTAYCAQTPWIQNLTLRQNVFFATPASQAQHHPEDQQRYEASVQAAALLPDIRILPSGDMTEIGEKGINLSGGQKARVALARAFCSSNRSQIYLLDDPFSAVDANTGNQIFRQGILGLLRDKLRIIALNSHMHLLRHFDRIVVLDAGRIVADGHWDTLIGQYPEMMRKLTGMETLVSAMLSAQTGLSPTQGSPVSGSPSISPSPSSATLADIAVVMADTAAANNTESEKSVASVTTTASTTAAVGGTKTTATATATATAAANTTAPAASVSFTGNLSGKAPEKKLIRQERVDSSLSMFVVYLKYFSAALSTTVLQ
jgi:ABC-type multidrug transport system ATPase subunit